MRGNDKSTDQRAYAYLPLKVGPNPSQLTTQESRVSELLVRSDDAYKKKKKKKNHANPAVALPRHPGVPARAASSSKSLSP